MKLFSRAGQLILLLSITEEVLRKFCSRVGIPYEDSMVNWRPIPEDQLSEFPPPGDSLGDSFRAALESSRFLPSSSGPARLKRKDLAGSAKVSIDVARPIYQRLKKLCI